MNEIVAGLLVFIGVVAAVGGVCVLLAAIIRAGERGEAASPNERVLDYA
jgi:hypothetical protein